MLAQLAPFLPSLAGGVLIGLASLGVLIATGRIAGISAMFSRVLWRRKDDALWRLVFLAGLIAGAALAFSWSDRAASFRPMRSIPLIAFAGILVGFGTRLGGGCTSGHGVCGVGRGSKSSIAATFIFVGVAMVTVFVVRVFHPAFLP
jgi:uncharacterized membrane protein YedE/YeeE